MISIHYTKKFVKSFLPSAKKAEKSPTHLSRGQSHISVKSFIYLSAIWRRAGAEGA